MPIENRTLTAGTRLVARYKKVDRVCEVVETAEGLRYRLDDGTEHRSPSSAGKVAMGGVACNGWRFWSLQGTEPARKPEAEKPAKAKTEPAPKEPKTKATPKKSAKTKAAPEKSAKTKSAKTGNATPGDASYGCGECPATFVTVAAAAEHLATHTA